MGDAGHRSLVITGGGGRRRLWSEIVAAVLDSPFRTGGGSSAHGASQGSGLIHDYRTGLEEVEYRNPAKELTQPRGAIIMITRRVVVEAPPPSDGLASPARLDSIVGIDEFDVSAPADEVLAARGLTLDRVVKAPWDVLN